MLCQCPWLPGWPFQPLVQSPRICHSTIYVLQAAELVLIPEQSRAGSAFSRTRAVLLCCSVTSRGSAGRQRDPWRWSRAGGAAPGPGQAAEREMELALLLAALLGLLIVKALLFQPRNASSPPCIRGWIPWFGAAFQFGKAPLEFIERARKKVMRVLPCPAAAGCALRGAACKGRGGQKNFCLVLPFPVTFYNVRNF